MNRLSQTAEPETDEEYRAIEAALLESARGRWFLAEHGRRARRLDSALLDDAIGRLQSSLRQPPAFLGQLENELSDLRQHLSHIRDDLLARPLPAAGMSETGQSEHPARSILKAAEDLHEVAWSLQANPFDPQGCELIARNAAQIYAASQHQAAVSDRTLALAETLAEAVARIEAVIESIGHERTVDAA